MNAEKESMLALTGVQTRPDWPVLDKYIFKMSILKEIQVRLKNEPQRRADWPPWHRNDDTETDYSY